MSRPAQRSGAAAAPSRSSLLADNGDICPVCKSMRYLNQGMKYMVNPECYHKMCESCVDRIFSSGPAPCPIAGCRRTLRKNRFREQRFEDIQIEREVDIRRRVASVFNRREDDFNTLLDYNNYLNEVEDITYDIIHGNAAKAEAAEKKLAAYAQNHRQEIARNALLAKEENASRKSREEASKEQARLRREAELLEDEMERQARVEGRRDIINQLAASDGDANAILKRAQTRRTVPVKTNAGENGTETLNGDAFVIKGLKKRMVPEPEKPYDPFHDMLVDSTYYIVQDHYPAPWLDGFASDKKHVGGGYEMHEYFSKTMFEAFSGLGVFVQEEVADRSLATGAFDTIAAPGKGIEAKVKADTTMDDVF